VRIVAVEGALLGLPQHTEETADVGILEADHISGVATHVHGIDAERSGHPQPLDPFHRICQLQCVCACGDEHARQCFLGEHAGCWCDPESCF